MSTSARRGGLNRRLSRCPSVAALALNEAPREESSPGAAVDWFCAGQPSRGGGGASSSLPSTTHDPPRQLALVCIPTEVVERKVR